MAIDLLKRRDLFFNSMYSVCSIVCKGVCRKERDRDVEYPLNRSRYLDYIGSAAVCCFLFCCSFFGGLDEGQVRFC